MLIAERIWARHWEHLLQCSCACFLESLCLCLNKYSRENFEIIPLILLTGLCVLTGCVFLWQTLLQGNLLTHLLPCSVLCRTVSTPFELSPLLSQPFTLIVLKHSGPPDKQSNSVPFSQGRFTAPIAGFQVNRVKVCSHCLSDSGAECNLYVQENVFF